MLIMRRRLFSGLSVVSLLLCIALIGLWMRSYRYTQDIWCVTWEPANEPDFDFWRYLLIAPRSDGLYIQWGKSWSPKPDEYPRHLQWASYHTGHRSNWRDSVPNNWIDWQLLGFVWDSDESNEFNSWKRGLVTPQWFAIPLNSILPIAWAFRWERRRRGRIAVKRHLCAACGYDLRATPDRCPECGAITDASPSI